MDPSLARAYLCLYFSRLLTPASLGRQLRECGSLELLLNQDGHEHLRLAIDQPPAGIVERVERELSWAAQADKHLLCYEQDSYPPQLKTIDDPPPLIWLHGNAHCPAMAQIAIVGSRKCSSYGRQTGHWLGRELSDCGLLVTSGLALGMDAAAHRGALSSGSELGRTVAVVATGLDITYPARHRELAEQVSEQGVLLSEFPLGTRPLAHHFPRRNRLISGLALGVVVVEAGLRSGSLITARLAMEQNREVFAVPGRINNGLTEGCHHLLKNGARLVEGPGDILEELPGFIVNNLKDLCGRGPASCRAADKNSISDPRCQKILQILDQGEALFETLQQDTGLSTESLHGCLLQLEIKGLLTNRGGRVYLVGDACQQ